MKYSVLWSLRSAKFYPFREKDLERKSYHAEALKINLLGQGLI